MKNIWLVGVLGIFALSMIVPAKALAGTTNSEIITVASDEIIEDSLYAGAGQIDIKGIVDGDVIAAAGQIDISGTVTGDVIVAGGQINVLGVVEGDVRAAGGEIMINGTVGKNVTAFGGTVDIGDEASIGKDILIAGGVINTDGEIGRNAIIAGNILLINSDILGKITMYQDGNDLGPAIGPSANVAGDITYTSNMELDIEDGAVVNGEVSQILPQRQVKEGWNKVLGMGMLLGLIVKLFGTWLIGLVLIYLCKDKMTKLLKSIKEEPLKNLGWGFIVLFLGPIVLLILMATIIGIPLALILLAVWLIALCLAKIIIGIFVGDYLVSNMSKAKPKKKVQDYRSRMILGTTVVILITAIPVVGWIVGFFVTLMGLGAIWIYLKNKKIIA